MNNHYAGEIQKLDFDSSIENLKLVEKLIDQISDEYKLNQDHYGNILVALTEAVSNAIIHGNQSVVEKKIYVSFEPHESSLRFIIQDEGNGFDFDNIPDPTDPGNIDKPNGRGVYIMKHLADKVDFSDNGRIVELTFNVSAN